MITFAFLAWIPITVLLFGVFRPARAVTWAYVGGWLFLPATTIDVQGFWNIDKSLVISSGVIAGVLLCCRNPLRGFRSQASDLLLLAFGCAAAISSITNGLGIYDGCSTMSRKLIYYGVAFWCGRVFLKDRRDLLDAAQVLCCAAAAYAVLALWEWRMSPQIHNFLYGVFQHSFYQHKRWGFYRPIVCFPHALSLGMFMACSSLLGWWLHRHRLLRPFAGVPAIVIVILPILGLLASFSMGPLALFALGFGLLTAWRAARLRLFAVGPLLLVLGWIGARYTAITDGEWVVSTASMVSQERADSLQYRISAETLLLDHARERPWFGWGGWARNQVFRASGRNAFANDAVWVIIVGCYGLAGLLAFYLWWCWPMVMASVADHRLERDPLLMVLVVLVGIESVNGLFNGVMSPVMILFAGGVVSVFQQWKLTPVPAVSPAFGGGAPVDERAVSTLQSAH